MDKELIFLAVICFIFSGTVVCGQGSSSWKTSVPEPVFEKKPGYVELYWKAWELAREKVKKQPGLPQSPYMDEGFWDDTIWIWDTCFMALFCKYAPDAFPGVESLKNFYVPLHDNSYEKGSYPLNIQHPDNPPLFAWVEHDNFVVTDNRAHVRTLLAETKYLQKHFKWFNRIGPGWRFHSDAAHRNSSVPTAIKKVENGYLWGAVHSGMDNTPRERHGLWVDAISQQALSALYISRLAKRLGQGEIAGKWEKKYKELKETINSVYWNEDDGIYYDVDPESGQHLKVKTPASYWPMLAEVCSSEQAEKMVSHIKDPDTFGGKRPWPSVSRSNPAFAEPDGDYWRGGIWLPVAYMATKALEKYDYYETADHAAERLLAQMLRTYRNYEPHTIWECYSPTRDRPGTHKGVQDVVRPDFCGWSALGPISMFIENVLGFHVIDAPAKKIEWRLHHQTKHGIKRLKFGNIVTDIVYDGESQVTVESSAPYTLVINGVSEQIAKGSITITLSPEQSPAAADAQKDASEE